MKNNSPVICFGTLMATYVYVHKTCSTYSQNSMTPTPNTMTTTTTKTHYKTDKDLLKKLTIAEAPAAGDGKGDDPEKYSRKLESR